ncbi:MAG: N-6 DNA methylase [Proteobacteria bacterium]|nr:N-6 DNA methylase [Pseudomonadota bacterium]MBU1714352.1 N-6 DNA methylase [Pseudomonadota bacterium]
MNIQKLEEDIRAIVQQSDKEDFIYDLLMAYGLPKAAITRLKQGTYNQTKTAGEILWKKKLYFKTAAKGDLHTIIDDMKTGTETAKQKPRFLIVTDFHTLLAIDSKTDDSLDISFKDLPNHFDFFLPWAGLEKTQVQGESLADIRAAERMGRLYDIICENNPTDSAAERHALNIFLSRLLFCFFAEDTGIFPNDQFTNGLASHTAEDGSDLQPYLQKLFQVLSVQERDGLPNYLKQFPYVNGGLFNEEYPVPQFNRKARQIIIECGALNWKEINPDIFGSMIQAVVHSDQRGSLGMHYTSVTNIMKVIEPLFLNDLYEELEKADARMQKGERKKALNQLLTRLRHIRIFDPACGSGNFLIIAYKELCKLEIEIIQRLYGGQRYLDGGRAWSNIKLTQFYGIEIDDFAQETAKLSLWLAEHQMNMAFKEVFGESKPTLPLQDGGNIVCGNATRLDWEEVCPKEEGTEIYILGNPPYLGARNQSKEQKKDMSSVFDGHQDYKDSDYVCCWFLKGAEYIHGKNASLGFVATNSICQGEQVGYLWPRVLENLEIGFAHQSFKWTNSAKGNAGVTCVIVGLRNISNATKKIYSKSAAKNAKNISPYLQEGRNSFIGITKNPISPFPKMVFGSMARDGGFLILSPAEKEILTKKYPQTTNFIRKLYGSSEFIRGGERWCLWITDKDLNVANRIPEIKQRIDAVYEFRISSNAKTTQGYASIPHKFAQRCDIEANSIIVPRTSSERREYIPIGFLDKGAVVTDSANAIYNASPYIFAVISSRMHMTWVRAVAGRLETRIRYSSALCYNTFPFPDISDKQKEFLEDLVFQVLDEREKHPEKTMAQLYDPDKMPDGLRQAHHAMDLAVEQCYRAKPFTSDEERLEYLFKLYEEMTQAEGSA